MTYPPQGDESGQGSYGQGSYGHSAQGAYGQDSYGQGAYAPGSYAQSSYGQSAAPSPPSNVGWAVAAIIFFWPLAFVGMTRALEVYPLWAAGRYSEAEAASATAKRMGVISLAIWAVLIVLYIVFIIAMVGMAAAGL